MENYNSFVEIFDFLKSLDFHDNESNLCDKIFTNRRYSETFYSHIRNNPLSVLNTNTTINFPKSFLSSKNYWVLKPVDLCQGKGIKISNEKNKIYKKIKKYFSGIDKNNYKDSDDENNSDKEENSPEHAKTNKNKNPRHLSSSVVLQKYLDNPLLYYNRKFDIRIWVLVDHLMNVYMFKEGHLKGSSEEYDINNKNPFVHLTNYSLQKNSSNFSKYEYGNEISYQNFQKFLNEENTNVNFISDIVPQFKNIIELSMNAVGKKINPKNSNFCFQIFGYDFIIDKNFKTWLLEINDNPGISISSPLIEKLVPRMIDDAFRLTIDKIFNSKYNNTGDIYNSRFEVNGYSNEENLWEFLCNIDLNVDIDITNSKSWKY
jgi:tubulin--tyrosine ligase